MSELVRFASPTHLISEGGQVPFESLVLPLQGLNAAQISSQVVVVERLVLFLDPIFRFVHVAMETLNFVSGAQLGRPLGRQLLQRRPLGVQFLIGEGQLERFYCGDAPIIAHLNLRLNFQRGFGLTDRHQLYCDLVHLSQTHFVGFEVGLEVVEFLLHHLYLF